MKPPCDEDRRRPCRGQRAPRRSWATALPTVPDTGVAPHTALRVVLVHSVALVAHAVADVLRAAANVELVGEVSVHDLLGRHEPVTPPDVVLVECLADPAPCSGVLRRVKQVFPAARALVLCRDLDGGELADLVTSGAMACLKPESGPRDLTDTIERVGRGEVLLPPAIMLRLLGREREPSAGGESLLPPDGGSGREGWPGSARGAGRQAPPSLAPRERQVLAALATGLSSDQVALELGITVHTVRAHLRSMMIKLDAHSKLEAVFKALRLGLIDPPAGPR